MSGTTAAADDADSDFEVEEGPFVAKCKVAHKRGTCPRKDKGEELYSCALKSCKSFYHHACSTLLLDHHQIENDRRPEDETVVFCTKTCFNKWEAKQKSELKKKEREINKKAKGAAKAKAKENAPVPWESDGSLEVLLDWITTEGNWAKYCGGKGNKGKSKSQCKKEIALLINSKRGTNRTEKQVENKITNIERAFKAATDWIANTGAGLDDPGDVTSHVKKLCSVYYDLEDVMSDRPNAQPLATSEDTFLKSMLGEDENGQVPFEYRNDSSDKEGGEQEGGEQEGGEKEPEQQPETERELVVVDGPVAEHAVTTPVVETPVSRRKPTEKRLTVTPVSKKQKAEIDATLYLHNNLLPPPNDGEGLHSISVRNAVAREKEASVRMLEATALSEKTKQETEGVRKANERAEMENQLCKMEMTAKLLTMRKQALERNECTEEQLGVLFSLPK